MTYMYMYMYIHTYMYSRNTCTCTCIHVYWSEDAHYMYIVHDFSYITVLQIEILCKEIVDFSYNLRSEYTYCLLHVSVHVLMINAEFELTCLSG